MKVTRDPMTTALVMITLTATLLTVGAQEPNGQLTSKNAKNERDERTSQVCGSRTTGETASSQATERAQ